MANKNPFLSLWLSGANAWTGAARGAWAAEAYRQQRAIVNTASKEMARFWTGAWMLPGAPPSKKGRRK
jgi:hypothetical protein